MIILLCASHCSFQNIENFFIGALTLNHNPVPVSYKEEKNERFNARLDLCLQPFDWDFDFVFLAVLVFIKHWCFHSFIIL